MSRPLKVFLCHAHADAKAVRALYDRLIADGVDVWLDKEKLIPGQDWEREIREAVREADVVIVCLSKQFNQRGYRQKEVRIALDEAEMMPEGEIFIIPARLEECENLESLRKWHWVDLYEKGGHEKLLRSLQFRAQKVSAELVPKKNLITSAFRKPITKHQNNPESKEQEKEIKEAKESTKSSFWGRLKKLAKEEVRKWLIGILFFIFAYFAVFIVPSWFANEKPTLQVTPTQTQKIILTATEKIVIEPSVTPMPSKAARLENTPTETLTPTATPLPEEISDIDPAGNKIPMRLIPAGEFIAGNDDDDISENPERIVYLDDFYIDKYEVTNAFYKACVEFGACAVPQNLDYFDSSFAEHHPVVYVDLDQAKTYCEWREAYLPDDEKWEKAARGTNGRTYPWGEGLTCGYANYSYNYVGEWKTAYTRACVGSAVSVGSYDSGVSPYGIYEMSGNVWEWVDKPFFEYDDTYYVIRGGAWNVGYSDIYSPKHTTYYRGKQPSSYSDVSIGFRCAKDAP